MTIEEGESEQSLAEAGEDTVAHGEPSPSRSDVRAVALGVLLLLVLMTFSIALRWEVLDRKACLEHDEAVAYMAAAGKESRWFDLEPANRWVPARDWLTFHQIDEPFAFETIRRDLVKNDMHPPLYFWLLHLTGVMRGLEPRTGGDLNLVLHVVGMGLLFVLGLMLCGHPAVALAAVGFWSFSPAVITTSLLVRQYELYALMTLATLVALLHVMQAQSRRALAGAALTGALLLCWLTHYQALLLLPLVMVIALVHWGWLRFGLLQGARANAALIAVAVAVCAAGAIYLLVQPDVFSELQVHLDRHGRAPGSIWNARWGRVEAAIVRFVPDLLSDGRALVFLVAVSGVGLVLGLLRIGRAVHEGPNADERAPLPILYAFVPAAFASGVIVLQYVSLKSPQHAMGDRYLSIVWPLLALWLALSIGLALRRWPIGAWAVLTVSIVLWAQHGRVDRFSTLNIGCIPGQMVLAERYSAVIVDSTTRGQLPRLFPHLAPDAAIYAAAPEQFYSDDSPLLPGLAEREGALVVHMRSRGMGQQGRRQLVEFFREAGYRIAPPDDPTAFLSRPDNLLVVAATRGARWPPALLDHLDQLGVATDRIRAGADYVAAIQRGRLLGEAFGEDGHAGIHLEVGGISVRARVGGRAGRVQGGGVEIALDDEDVVGGGAGLAIFAYDLAAGEVLNSVLHLPSRRWLGEAPVFRVWQPAKADERVVPYSG